MNPLYRYRLNVDVLNRLKGPVKKTYDSLYHAENEKDAIKAVTLKAEEFGLRLLRVNWVKCEGEV
jgi:hypothetical protein